jgi:hypothetical protein
MPLFLLKDKVLSKEVQNLGIKLEHDIQSIVNRSSDSNPQLLFKAFKDEVNTKARERAKIVVPKMEHKINELKKQLDSLLQQPNLDSEQHRISAGLLEEQIAKLESQRHRKARIATAAHDRLEGETISKYWSQVNKQRKPRDIIHALEKPNTTPPQYTNRSDKMAELARDYHHNLLSDGLNTPQDLRSQITDDVLNSIEPETLLPNRNKATMAEKLTEQEVREALKTTKNGTATGLNGLPYEL